MQSPVVVVNALIKNHSEDKFLIVKRNSKSKIHPSLWMFPGGKVEANEDLIEALKREIKEETDLEIGDIKKISEYEYKRPDNSITFGICFSAASKTESVKLNKELEDFKWITPQEFKNYNHLKGLDEEIKKVFN